MKNVNKIEETYSSSWSFIHSYYKHLKFKTFVFNIIVPTSHIKRAFLCFANSLIDIQHDV